MVIHRFFPKILQLNSTKNIHWPQTYNIFSRNVLSLILLLDQIPQQSDSSPFAPRGKAHLAVSESLLLPWRHRAHGSTRLWETPEPRLGKKSKVLVVEVPR